MKILVSGSGIAGLTLALCLAQLNDLPLNLFYRRSQCDHHGPCILFASLNLLRKMPGLNRSILHRDDKPFHEISQLPNVSGPPIEP